MSAIDRRKSLTLGLPESAVAKLTELADRDFRSPRHEAAALLVEAIERAIRAARRSERTGAQTQDPRADVR